MPIKIIIKFVFILFTSFSQIILAKTNNNKSELTVEADESLEWFEKEKYYLAKGNVTLKKDGVTLKANIVRADYVCAFHEALSTDAEKAVPGLAKLGSTKFTSNPYFAAAAEAAKP